MQNVMKMLEVTQQGLNKSREHLCSGTKCLIVTELLDGHKLSCKFSVVFGNKNVGFFYLGFFILQLCILIKMLMEQKKKCLIIRSLLQNNHHYINK